MIEIFKVSIPTPEFAASYADEEVLFYSGGRVDQTFNGGFLHQGAISPNAGHLE